MICQKCKQRSANAHIHYVHNGIVRDMYLCDSCAADYKNSISYDGDIFKMLSSFLSDNIGVYKETLKCECCGTDFNTICKSGMVGCGNCYSVFEKQLSPIIARIHGKTMHVGKKPCEIEVVLENDTQVEGPKINEKEQQIAELKSKMTEAVAKEDFELAACLRDEIKSLEEK